MGLFCNDKQLSKTIYDKDESALVYNQNTYDRYLQGYVSLAVGDDTRATNAIRINSFEREGAYAGQSRATSNQINYIDVKTAGLHTMFRLSNQSGDLT